MVRDLPMTRPFYLKPRSCHARVIDTASSRKFRGKPILERRMCFHLDCVEHCIFEPGSRALRSRVVLATLSG